jgi:hypothetical protein
MHKCTLFWFEQWIFSCRAHHCGIPEKSCDFWPAHLGQWMQWKSGKMKSAFHDLGKLKQLSKIGHITLNRS